MKEGDKPGKVVEIGLPKGLAIHKKVDGDVVLVPQKGHYIKIEAVTITAETRMMLIRPRKLPREFNLSSLKGNFEVMRDGNNIHLRPITDESSAAA